MVAHSISPPRPDRPFHLSLLGHAPRCEARGYDEISVAEFMGLHCTLRIHVGME